MADLDSQSDFILDLFHQRNEIDTLTETHEFVVSDSGNGVGFVDGLGFGFEEAERGERAGEEESSVEEDSVERNSDSFLGFRRCGFPSSVGFERMDGPHSV
ncbi:hypothetical protein Droror1_Dr00024221 [Drosera rotundifolia]